MLHLLPLSFSCPCACGPSRRFADGSKPSQRVGPGSRSGVLGGGIRRRALRGTGVQPDTSSSSSPSSRQGGNGRHDEAERGEDDGGELLLPGALQDAAAGAGQEEQGQFPKRWAIVFLCFSAFLLCNMDRVRTPAPPIPISIV